MRICSQKSLRNPFSLGHLYQSWHWLPQCSSGLQHQSPCLLSILFSHLTAVRMISLCRRSAHTTLLKPSSSPWLYGWRMKFLTWLTRPSMATPTKLSSCFSGLSRFHSLLLSCVVLQSLSQREHTFAHAVPWIPPPGPVCNVNNRLSFRYQLQHLHYTQDPFVLYMQLI